MSDITQDAAIRRGANYLAVLGVLGFLLAMYLLIEGFAQLWSGRFMAGFGSLVIGAFLGAADVRVLKLWREVRDAGKPARGQ